MEGGRPVRPLSCCVSGLSLTNLISAYRSDTSHSLSITSTGVIAVYIQPEKPSKNISIVSLSLASGKFGGVFDTVSASIESLSYIDSSPGLLSWTENSLRTLKLLPLSGNSHAPTSVAVPEGVVDIAVHSAGNTVLVHYKTVDKSWATVYRWQVDSGLVVSVYNIEPKDGTGSAFSVSNAGNGMFFVWSHVSGEVFLYGDSEAKPLAVYTSKTPLGKAVLHAASEVVTRADGTSYAVRSFVSTASPGFRGDTHLVRNGDVEWTRKESLASVVVSGFAELLDPAAEKVAEELNAEGHKSVGAAYVHRLTRHIQELIEFGPAWVVSIPERVKDAFLNKEKIEVGGRWRDFFGYRKYVIVATAEGGLAAIDIGKRGEVAWEASILPSGGDWKGVLGVYEVSKGVMGVVTTGSEYLEVDAFEGTILKREKIPGCGSVKSSSAVEGVGRKLVLAVLKCGKVIVLPLGAELPEPIYLAVQDDAGHAKGLKVTTSGKPSTTWTFTPPTSEIITSISTRPAHDPVASIGRVLGDRSVMYKYLNPHLISIITSNPLGSTASVHLIDSVSGAVLYSTTHTGVDTSKSIVSTVAENWIVYAYYGGDDAILGDAAARGYHLVVSELFESDVKNDRGPLGGALNYTSLAGAPGTPAVLSQSYIFPGEIGTFATTSTRQGITSHEILALLPDSRAILSIPKRMLDPRRPIGRDPNAAESEEGLFKYVPVVEIDPRALLNHKRELLGIKQVTTTPALLESTSLVFAYGGDLFGTRVTPSMAFDVLAKGFSKVQLVGTILALGVGVGFVAPMVRRKQINQRWSGV